VAEKAGSRAGQIMSKRIIAAALIVGAVFGAAVTGTAAVVLGGGPGTVMRPRWADSAARGMPGPMHAQMSVSSEFDYLTQMIPHHREAVAAARQLARSERPELREFGQTIARTQAAEIRQMESWLRAWYRGRDTRVDYQPMMRDLSRLSGEALDRAFLQDMIRHHMGAVMMSQQLLRRDLARHDEVRTFAQQVRDAQRAEIIQMHRWLGGGGMHGGDMHRGGTA
jgi:uncharacterized protein (DUF305 family)